MRPTWLSAPFDWRRVVRYDSESPPSSLHQAGVSVLTTRSTPPNSDSDHWLSR